jgi:translation initiation factor 3 subunit D
MVGFKLIDLQDNQDGWGPITMPPEFQDVPFMPYSKGERLGRIADFGQQPGQQRFQGMLCFVGSITLLCFVSHLYEKPSISHPTSSNHHTGRFRESTTGAVLNFEKQEEDSAFELVDNKPVKKPSSGMQRRPQYQPKWGQQQGGGGRDGGAGRGGFGGQGARTAGGRGGRGAGRGMGQGGRFQPWHDQQRAAYTSSVDIRPEWPVIGDQINFTALSKLSTTVDEPEEITTAGALAAYDRAADRVTLKTPAKLNKASQRARSCTSSEDPVLQKLAKDADRDSTITAKSVLMTDHLLTTLMCAPRSVYPWDIVITLTGNQLWFDKRANSSLDYLTNGETAPEPLPEEKDNVNGMQQLSMEATAVNTSFREQMLSTSGEPHSLQEPLPADMAAPAHAGYRYRKWSLGGSDLYVRCEVDATMKGPDGSVQMVAVHALNEFDPKWAGVDWRTKLENQRGAVLATELKNNANKLAKWTAAALVGGIDMIKLGYVTRATPKNNNNHLLLGTQAVKPKDFAMQMNLNMDNCWGIVRALVDFCFENLESDGKFFFCTMCF